MNNLVRLLTLLILSLILSACSLPLKVVQVENLKEPVKGVRYFLKRPSYVAGLKIDLKDENTKFFSNPTIAKSDGYIQFINKNNSGSDIKGSELTKRAIYCMTSGTKLHLTLQQTMDGNPMLFEARSRMAPQHLLADSESSITLDDNGNLTAIMAGEDDKSLEFIQAVAGLAVKAVGLGRVNNVEETCMLINDDNFKKYINDLIELTARRESLIEKLNTIYGKLELSNEANSKIRLNKSIRNNSLEKKKNSNIDTLEEMKLEFELISILQGKIDSINEELDKLQYKLPSHAFEIKEKIDEKNKRLVQPADPKTKPWFTFTLTPL